MYNWDYFAQSLTSLFNRIYVASNKEKSNTPPLSASNKVCDQAVKSVFIKQSVNATLTCHKLGFFSTNDLSLAHAHIRLYSASGVPKVLNSCYLNITAVNYIQVWGFNYFFFKSSLKLI